ncbi:M23 family metallopeptidase [Pseudonocardia sp.]|uniref:M23 family metallopeptidase n=1 Tax=Pseudonocardia sp. TaxID=60912 RepID=UPI003D0D6FD5
MTIAAVAAGAAVAGGQTAFTTMVDSPTAPLVPVAARTSFAEGFAAVPQGIGGDLPPLGTLQVTSLDPGDQVDVANLAKAVDIGAQLAKKAKLLDSALADGAPTAVVRDGLAFVQPALGRFTSGFGARWGRHHDGIDIANRIGTPIYAVTDGVVEESGPASGFGLWIVLRHTDGTQSVYGHINRSFVKEGQRVKAGEQIAEVGNRGISTGPHLHFEVWDADGTKLNPITWLREHGITI